MWPLDDPFQIPEYVDEHDPDACSQPIAEAPTSEAAANAPQEAGSAPVDGSAPPDLGHWPALHVMGGSHDEFGSEQQQQHRPSEQQLPPAHQAPCQSAPSDPTEARAPVEAPGLQHLSQSAPAQDDRAQATVQPEAAAAPDKQDAWVHDRDNIDELLLEQEELQQFQEQQLGGQAALGGQAPAATQPVSNCNHNPGATGAADAHDSWSDDFDELLREQEEIVMNQPPPPLPAHLQPQLSTAAPPPPPHCSRHYDEDILDLDAELDELDEIQQEVRGAAAEEGGSRKRQRTSQGSRIQTAGAAGAAGGANLEAEMDFGDELDDLFDDLGDADPSAAAEPEVPSVTALKPATLASLAGGIAGRSTAEVLAALEAAAVPPQQFASALSGFSVTVTGSSGQRVFCQLAAARPQQDRAAGAADAATIAAVLRLTAGLLVEPIDVLLDRLAERRRLEVLSEYEAAQALAQEMEALINEEQQPEAAEAEPAADQNQQQAEPQHDAQQVRPKPSQQHAQARPGQPQRFDQLWVDRYAPKSFLQLLSEPRINREIAAWMAKWKKQPGQQQHQQQQQQQQQKTKQSSSFNGNDRRQQPPLPPQGKGNDRSGVETVKSRQRGGAGGNIKKGFDAARYQAAQAARAAAKILLVVGPPGTGKTTLAHVLAAHCGFRVVEINASDDRTATSLTKRITDAAQMTHVLEGTRHPPCIVLDELDGASGGGEAHNAVAAVVRLVTGASATGKQRKRGSSKTGSKAGCTNLSGGLGVPLIATANDAYAPCLRPLRDIAAVYHFKPPGPDRLMSRLAVIAAAEQLIMDRQALSALVERSGCDIRTAINTLQLLARQAAKPGSAATQNVSQGAKCITISADAVWSNRALGIKDVSRTPLGVLQDLLTAETNKAMTARLHQLVAEASTASGRTGARGRGQASATAGAAVAARVQLQEHYNMLLDLGEHELIMAGLQEHLQDVVGLDVDLASTAAATAALADADRLLAGGVTSGSNSSGGRGMTQYVPACVLAATRLARREGGGLTGGGGISWPRAQAECGRAAASSRVLLRSWRATAPASAAASMISGHAAVLDFAPALTAMSRPAGLKAVSRQLMSVQQAALLDHSVSCLVSYGVTFSFPADEANHLVAPTYAAAAGQQLPRPAPLSPAIDTIHVYSALGKASNRVIATPVGMGGRAHAVMPLVLRQMMAQMISAANILRLDKGRQSGEQSTPAAGNQSGAKTPGNVKTAAPSGPVKALDHRAAAKAAVLPTSKVRPAGTWLDALKARTAPKRKAAAAAQASKAKRPATHAAVAGGHNLAAQPTDGQCDAAAECYTVLYKFNEGYTNAVKRPMKVSEWLQ